jgi:glycosyltransferase involved in cell wall biosynthesis
LNNSNPFFSIVIPTYNRGDLITKTIDSVLSQSFRDFEILVVDNKSQDNTIEVLQPYVEAQKIQFYQNDMNNERAYSRNRGFELAKGEYITLLDSDDILYSNCLQDAYEFAQKNSECKIFHAKYDMIDINGNYKSSFNFPEISNPLKALAKGNFLSNIAIFYKRDLIKKIRYDETPILIGVEDYDFLIRAIGYAGHLGRINTILAGLREHPNRSVHHEESEKTIKRIDYFYKKHTQKKEYYMYPFSGVFKAYLYLYLCSFFAVRHSFVKALSYIIKSAIGYPAILIAKRFWHCLAVVVKKFLFSVAGLKK